MFLNEREVGNFRGGVDVRGEDDCWPWTRYCNKAGYGCLKLRGLSVLAHRVAWALDRNRQIPELFEGRPSMICHTCDEPSCCNPRHLFLGNCLINSKDCVDKGRHIGFSEGESHLNADLTVLQVKEAKILLEEGVLFQREIAEMYGVGQTTIAKIATGESWSHVKLKDEG